MYFYCFLALMLVGNCALSSAGFITPPITEAPCCCQGHITTPITEAPCCCQVTTTTSTKKPCSTEPTPSPSTVGPCCTEPTPSPSTVGPCCTETTSPPTEKPCTTDCGDCIQFQCEERLKCDNCSNVDYEVCDDCDDCGCTKYICKCSNEGGRITDIATIVDCEESCCCNDCSCSESEGDHECILKQCQVVLECEDCSGTSYIRCGNTVYCSCQDEYGHRVRAIPEPSCEETTTTSTVATTTTSTVETTTTSTVETTTTSTVETTTTSLDPWTGVIIIPPRTL